jgi:MFS superfamily sulfate permease-like transporter
LHRGDVPHSLFSRQTITDILEGLSVSLALLPECLGLVAGVAPLVRLYAAFIIGLTIEVSILKA